ncbi:MAG: hypothetical protein U9R58_08390, partial [Chloroflexota bacterium]|nr:hypothetical protein [Chloroflexota bacterium]
MAKLLVDNKLVSKLVGEVSPLVRKLTRWELAANKLRCRVIPKQRGYEEIFIKQLQYLGIPVFEDDPRDFFKRLAEYLLEANVLAAYLPWNDEIIVVRENVDDSNLDGLRVILGHELVHRAQHVNHPRIFQRLEILSRRIFLILYEALAIPDLEQIMDTLMEIRSIMTLFESHASVVQHTLNRNYYPDAWIESHWSLPSLLFRLFGAEKLSQYQDGIPMVMEAMERGAIDDLYQSKG